MSENYWKLTDEEYEFIKGEVTHIFLFYKVKCIPVSGFEIASKMGISLITYSCLSKKKLSASLKASEDGFFLETGDHEYIFYNDIDRFRNGNKVGQPVFLHPGDKLYEKHKRLFKGVK